MTSDDRLNYHTARIANQLQQAGLLCDFLERSLAASAEDACKAASSLRLTRAMIAELRADAEKGGAR